MSCVISAVSILLIIILMCFTTCINIIYKNHLDFLQFIRTIKISYAFSGLLNFIMTKVGLLLQILPFYYLSTTKSSVFRRRKDRKIILNKWVCSPVIVFFAVDASVFAEAGELRLQVEFTLAALQTAHVPLLVHGEQVIAIRDLASTARTQSHPVPADGRHVLQKHTDDHRTR